MQKTRTYSYDPRRISSKDMATRTGLEVFQAMQRGELPAPSAAQTFGYTLTQIEHGVAVFEGQPEDYLNNPIGTVHGGYAASLLDTVLGCAVQAALPLGTASTTTDLNVKFVRALLPGIKVRAEGRLVHLGRSLATAEAKLVGLEDGKLYAHGSGTFQLMKLGGAHE
jgi:uncharacterized protein (TIGR00369 family)